LKPKRTFFVKQNARMIQRNIDLATKALKSLENGVNQPTKKRALMSCPGASNTLGMNGAGHRSTSLKRSRSALSGTFDMGEFLKASQQVEETIVFPSIEWPSFDDDESSTTSDTENSFSTSSSPREEFDEDDEEEYSPSPRKRQCRGLTRCGKSCNLQSLWQISGDMERRGSFGSLS